MLLNKLHTLIRKAIIFFLRRRGIRLGYDSRFSGIPDFRLNYINGKKGSINIQAQAEFGKGVVIKSYGGDIAIAANTFLGEYVVIYGHGGIHIGANTLIAMHTCIVSSNHTIPPQHELIRYHPDVVLPVTIGDDVWIGAGCKILGGVTIGNGCVVGAGSVVTRDLPPYSISVGNPARVIKFRDAAR